MSRTVDIKIKTTADNSGIDKTTKSLDTLDKSQQAASTGGKALTESVTTSGKSLNSAAETAGALSSALDAGGPAAAKMSGAVRGLSSVITGATQGIAGLASVLLAAGITAYVKYQKQVEEAKETVRKFKAEIEQNKLAIAADEINTLSSYYNDLALAIDQATAAQQKLTQARAAADNVEKAERMALLELEEKRALNKISPGDSLARSETSASFATQRRQLDQEFQEKSAARVTEATERAAADAAAKEKAAETAMRNQQAALAENQAQQAEAQAELGALYTTKIPKRTISTAGGMYNPYGQPGTGQGSSMEITDTATQKAEADAIKEKLSGEKGLEALAKALQASIAALSPQLESARAETQAAALNAASAARQQASITGTNPEILAATTTGDTAQARYARQNQLKEAQKGISGYEDRESDLRDRVRKEWKEYSTASRDETSTTQRLEKEMTDWREATANLNKFLAAAGPAIKELKETSARATEALNNLP